MEFDVAIIGGGVIGCAVARELSRFSLRVALFEAGEDVAQGASRANSAIVHAGYDCSPGSLMARLNVAGNAAFPGLCRDLNVPFHAIGSLVIAFPREEGELERLLDQGQRNAVPGLRLLNPRELREMQPGVAPEAIAALWAPTAGITCPYALTIALAENAIANGARFFLNAPVTELIPNEAGFCLTAGGADHGARFVVNAAGVHAGEIAALIEDCIPIEPRRGEYLLLDRRDGAQAGHVLFMTPGPLGKGILVSPTVDGNLLLGPTADRVEDGEDTATTTAGLARVWAGATRLLPRLQAHPIANFAGVRAISGRDFVIRPATGLPHLIHAAGICSPGLTSAPAIAGEVLSLLRQAGLEAPLRRDFQPRRAGIPAFAELSAGERDALIAQDPAWGRVICRCETVTEAQVVLALRGGLPIASLDAVKRRVRAGMGRCSGGFCSPRVMEIIARERKIPLAAVTKMGLGSELVWPRRGGTDHAR